MWKTLKKDWCSVLLIATTLFDICQTWHLVGQGFAREGNPLMASYVSTYGLPGLAVVKLGLLLGWLGMLWCMGRIPIVRPNFFWLKHIPVFDQRKAKLCVAILYPAVLLTNFLIQAIWGYVF